MLHLLPQRSSSLSSEPDTGEAARLRIEDGLSLAHHYLRQGDGVRAEAILQVVAGEVAPGSQDSLVRERVNRMRDALRGEGEFTSARAEFLAGSFVDQVMDPAALGAMLGGGAVYRVSRLGFLRALTPLTEGLPILSHAGTRRAMASLLAFSLEAPSFSVLHNVGTGAMGRPVDWSAAALQGQIRSSFLMLGGLKAFGFLGSQSARYLAAGGGWGALACHQGAMYLGILAGRLGDSGLGANRVPPTGTLLLESLVTLIHFNGMGALLRGFSGPLPGSQSIAPPPRRGESGIPWQFAEATAGAAPGPIPGRTRAPTAPPSTHIVMMSGSGEDPNPNRPISNPGEWPLPEPLRENLGNLHELSPGEILEDLFLEKCRTHTLAPKAYELPESSYLERIHELFPKIHMGNFILEPLVLRQLHKVYGPVPLEHLQLPARPQNLLLEENIDTLGGLASRLEQGNLKEIHGFGPRWEKVCQSALAGFVGLPQLIGRLTTYREIKNHFRSPRTRRELTRLRHEARMELQQTRPRDGVTESREYFLNPAAQSVGEFFRIRPGVGQGTLLQVTADYRNNLIHLSNESFLALEAQAFHPGAGNEQRNWAMALMGLAGERIIPEVEGSIMVRSSYPPPPEAPVPAASAGFLQRVTQSLQGLWATNPVPPQLPEYLQVEREYGGVTVSVDVAAGVRRVRASLEAMNPDSLEALRQVAHQSPQQPWLVAGISDGMGFHSAVALIASGMMRYGVGVFYEPPALLQTGSEAHLARLANVEGLRVLASEQGADLALHYADLVLPRWGHPEGARPFPSAVLDSIEASIRKAPCPDMNFINSIAFARWISPNPEAQRRTQIPSVDPKGRVVLMDMKPYRERRYEETLDSMGRNHGEILDQLRLRFGPRSRSFFYTWAGGSQNFQAMRGIYGLGSLGDAKELGEIRALEMHQYSMTRDFTYGFHKVVRYPAFLSLALFGIPGGGAFGLISRAVLSEWGFYQSMPGLALQTFVDAHGVNNRRNPLSQIEFDAPERTFMPRIMERMAEFERRVEAYRLQHPEWDGRPLDPVTSRRLLEGLVDSEYTSQLPRVGD